MLFLSFFYVVKKGHFCSYPNSKGDILQEALTFWRLLNIPIFTQCSKLTVKAMFARLRKLQCFKAMESFTAGFGRHSRQWVKG